MAAASIARVLIDSPLPQLDRLFDYSIPEQFAAVARVGVRVKVPLRSAGRVADGYIVEVLTPSDGDTAFGGVLSAIESVVSEVVVVPPELYTLARRVADRAAGSASDILRLVVPTRQVRVEKAFLAATEVPQTPPVIAQPIVGYPPSRIEEGVARGERLAVRAIPLPRRAAGDSWVGHWAISMAQAAAASIATGRSAILAVPDYRDQEQLEAALASVVPSEIVVRVDARQSNPDRYRGFLRCLHTSSPIIVIGNRSAVFAPVSQPGLIALWDDGDPLFSEPLSPYVHARDVALIRQELDASALMFLSHSRSTEVQRLVDLGWLTDVEPQPAVRPKVIPTAQQTSPDPAAARARIPSTAWQEAKRALEHGPVLVQVAKPGYSPRLSCVDCSRSARCNRCEGPLAQRSATAVPACSWCGALATKWVCSHCEGTRLRYARPGATRTGEELGRAFPGVRVIVADGERPILEVGAEPALVIATRGAEPIATGGFAAVLLLDGDSMIARESLRVAEDCLRWWSNAAALARPGAPIVLVGVGGALASTMATWRQPEFARAELHDRRALRFPPSVRVASVTGTPEAVSNAIAQLEVDPSDILGPVDLADGAVRSIVRFDYGAASHVAETLRAEVIAAAAKRRKTLAAKGAPPRATSTLKVRFDDVEPFVDA